MPINPSNIRVVDVARLLNSTSFGFVLPQARLYREFNELHVVRICSGAGAALPRVQPRRLPDRFLGESAQYQPPEIHCLDVRATSTS